MADHVIATVRCQSIFGLRLRRCIPCLSCQPVFLQGQSLEGTRAQVLDLIEQLSNSC